MYSAEVVQESLQRRQQPWGWGAQWLAIRSWQQPNESNHWSWSSYNYTRTCQRTQHQPFYGHLAFEANWKGEKAPKVSGSWADHISKASSLKCHLLLFFAITMNHFSIGLWWEMKSEFYTTTSNNQLSGWTEKKLQSTSQSQTCTPKKVMVTGSLLPVWSPIDL